MDQRCAPVAQSGYVHDDEATPKDPDVTLPEWSRGGTQVPLARGVGFEPHTCPTGQVALLIANLRHTTILRETE